MILGSTGESRVNGYLFVLERALRTFLPRDVAADAVREVNSHIRERIASVEPMPNERDALERVLAELGPPRTVARAYSDEMAVAEAITTGRSLAIARATLRLATTSVGAFFAALLLFTGYAVGLGFAVVAVMKPIAPDRTGLWLRDGLPVSFGTMDPVPADAVLVGGYWVVPIAVALSLVILLVTHRAARAWLGRFRGRFNLVGG